MIRKFFFRTFFKPKLCSKINTRKYPWGWKSQEQIKYIIDYPFNDKVSRIEPSRKEIHEYKLINYNIKDFVCLTFLHQMHYHT